MFLYVDASHPATHASGTETFIPGSERGRAWVWSATKKTIVCAGAFDATTPPEVEVTHYGDDNHDLDADVALELQLRRISIRPAGRELGRRRPAAIAPTAGRAR